MSRTNFKQNFINVLFRAYKKENLKNVTFENIIPKIRTDPTLQSRLSLCYASILARILNLLPKVENIVRNCDISQIQAFCQNLLSVSGQIPSPTSHADLIAWNIDQGLYVKGIFLLAYFTHFQLLEYALTFLGHSMFDDVACSEK